MTPRGPTQPGPREPVVRLAGVGTGEPADGSAKPERVDLRHFVLNALTELRRRWLLALSVFLLVVVPAGAYSVAAVPTYTSVGAIQVATASDGLSMANPLSELMGTGAADVFSEVAILKRRGFLLRSFKKLGLQWQDPASPGFVTGDLNISLRGQSPISARLRDLRTQLGPIALRASTIQTARVSVRTLSPQALEIQFLDPAAAPTVANLGKPIQHDLIQGTLTTLPALTEPVQLNLLSDGALAIALTDHVTVVPLGTTRDRTNLVEVSFTHPDRETARAMVESLMQEYLAQSLAWQTLSASKSAEFVTKQLEEVGKTLAEDEGELSKFSKTEKAVQLDAQATVTIQEVAGIDEQLIKTDLQERGMGFVVGQMKSNQGAASLTGNFFEDPVLAQTVGALTKLETEYAVLKASLTEDHPKVLELGKQLDLYRAQVKEQISSARKNIAVQRGTLSAKRDAALSQLAKYPEKELQLARHVRKVEVNQRLYSFLLEKLQEASILEASTTINKRVVDEATVPYLRTSPKRVALVGIAGMLGLMLSVGSVFLASTFKRRLDSVESVKLAAPFPVYGMIPRIGSNQSELVAPKDIWGDHYSPAAEAFRSLCVGVSMVPHAERARIVQVTSSLSGEGKSTVVANLATALRRSGQRVLVVDCDLRRPTQHRTWRIHRQPGLLDAIVGSKDAARESIHTTTEGVDLIPAGTRSPDTVAPFMGNRFAELIKPWASQYDYILLDCAPAFVAETVLVSSVADLVLLVARPGVVQSSDVKHAVEVVQRAGAARGLVVNGVDKGHMGYGAGQSYYYYAGRYGKDGGSDESKAKVS